MSEEDGLVSGYADFERSSMAIGVGSIIAGKSSRIQQILRAQALSPKDRFMESVQYICYTENMSFNQDVFEMIASRFPRPQYLSARLCVYVVNILLFTAGQIRMRELSADSVKELTNNGILVLDAYRYGKMLLELLK